MRPAPWAKSRRRRFSTDALSKPGDRRNVFHLNPGTDGTFSGFGENVNLNSKPGAKPGETRGQTERFPVLFWRGVKPENVPSVPGFTPDLPPGFTPGFTPG